MIQDRVLAKISFNEDFGTYGQVKDRVRNKCDAVDVANPRRLHSAHNRARHQGVNIAIRENDKAGTQRGYDAILELVCKVCGIEETERSGPENIALHCLFKLATDEH